MITAKMNSDEILGELKRDYPKIKDLVTRETLKNRNKLIKIYRTTKQPVPFKETKVMNLSGNKYHIIIKSWPEKNSVASDLVIYAIVNNSITGKKNVVYFPTLNMDNGNIVIFEAHFIKRYRERFLKNENISFEKTIDMFIRNNPIFTIRLSETETEKDWNLEGRASDGVCLGIGHVKSRLFRFITFISDEMLRENQIYLSDNSPVGQVLKMYKELKEKEKMTPMEAYMELAENFDYNV